jgi:hypothetical protein
MLMICLVAVKIEERNRQLRFFWITCFVLILFLKTLRFAIVFLFFRLIFQCYYDGFDFCVKFVSYFVMIIVSFTVIT